MDFQQKGMATGGRKLEEMAQMVAQMEEDGVADEHMKAMWAGQSNILVAVRVRPLLKHDVIKKSIVRVLDAKVVVIMDPSHDKNDVLRGNRSREKQYAFDYVFEPGSTQQSVYNHTSKFLIHGVLDGFNATVFAYGNTGAGKTHTMIGSTTDPGIMVRIMNDLFHYSQKAGNLQGNVYKVTVSFLEVYNENIKDLLSETEEYLDLREDPIAGPMVAGILEIEAKNSNEIMNLLQTGNQRRTQQPTAANEVSSRSHAVFQVVVECKDRAPGTVANIKVGKLSLVDLAGSERAANTKNSGKRLVEGANINRSLLALGNCINALGEKGNKGNFVPYRDSKLTRLLKDSLGGNCRTVMIANISSAESCFEETLNTLKYANRAKNIKTNVQRNVLNVNYHISEYVNLIANLRAEIKILKDQISIAPPNHMTPLNIPPMSPNHKGVPPLHPAVASPLQVLRQPSTPLQTLRDSMRSATSLRSGGEGREVLNQMRQKIVDNFQERMQLRRSLIELEDQNVQNSIEVSKRQMILVNWSGDSGVNPTDTLQSTDLATEVLAHGPPEIKEALSECEQLRKAISKNNAMKKNIEKRLRNNEKEAESFRAELSNKITGEDRRELMELQYQVGKLELENMELEQHRIVHESILKGKDLTIQKLKLQLAVKDKIIKRQRTVLSENGLNRIVGYEQLAAMERALMDADTPASPPSPPRNIGRNSKVSNKVEKSHSYEEPVVDQVSSNYSNPVSARDPDPQSHHFNSHKNEWTDFNGDSQPNKRDKIPPISQVKSSSDSKIPGNKLLGGPIDKKLSPEKHDHHHYQQQQQQQQHRNDYDDGDIDMEESDDFNRKGKERKKVSNNPSGGVLLKKKPTPQRLGSPYSDDGEESSDRIVDLRPNVQQLSDGKKPKAPALIFPSDQQSDNKTPLKAPIRQGGLNSLNSNSSQGQLQQPSGQKVLRQVQPIKGGRGVIQNEERWMEGGASNQGNNNSDINVDSKFQPTTPRGAKQSNKGSYESKFDRDRNNNNNSNNNNNNNNQHHINHHQNNNNNNNNHQQHQQQRGIQPSNSLDDMEVLDDISESNDYISNALYDDDNQSIVSDISIEKINESQGGIQNSPGQENSRDNFGPKTRIKKQKNLVLGKLNKQKFKSDSNEESYSEKSTNGNGIGPSPSISELQIGPSSQYHSQQQSQQSQVQQKPIKQMKPLSHRPQGKYVPKAPPQQLQQQQIPSQQHLQQQQQQQQQGYLDGPVIRGANMGIGGKAIGLK